MSSWHSYSKIFNVGHKELQDLLLDEVRVDEKIDGSQFSFGIFPPDTDKGQLNHLVHPEYGPVRIRVRSRGSEFYLEAPAGMFERAVEVVKELAPKLKLGWTYRGEYLAKPKHNVLAYDRTPKNNIILFDIAKGEEDYLTYEELKEEAERINLEVVPLIYNGKINDIAQFRQLIDRTSILGSVKIEGIVIKNYKRYSADKKVLMGKFVSESFKEVHQSDWKERNPGTEEILLTIVNKYKNTMRWEKAIQHLREKGEIEDSPRDIGKLIKEIREDIKSECKTEIAEMLFKWAWDKIGNSFSNGLPEWYKDRLLVKQFEDKPPSN